MPTVQVFCCWHGCEAAALLAGTSKPQWQVEVPHTLPSPTQAEPMLAHVLGGVMAPFELLPSFSPHATRPTESIAAKMIFFIVQTLSRHVTENCLLAVKSFST